MAPMKCVSILDCVIQIPKTLTCMRPYSSMHWCETHIYYESLAPPLFKKSGFIKLYINIIQDHRVHSLSPLKGVV